MVPEQRVQLYLSDRRSEPSWLRAVLVCAVAVFWFWLLLSLLEYLAQPDAAQQPTSVTIQTASERQVVHIMAEPGFIFLDAERHPHATFEHRFELSEPTPLGLYLGFTRRLVEFRINNNMLRPEMGDEDWGTLSGFEPAVIAIPQRFTQTGSNLLEIKAVGGSRKILPNIAVGDYWDLFAAYRWGNVLTTDLVYAAIGVMLFVSLLILLLIPHSDEPRRLQLLVALMVIWSFRNACFVGLDSYFPAAFEKTLHFAITYSFLAVITVFTLSWLGYARRWQYLTGATWMLSCIVLLLPADSASGWFHRSFAIETVLSVVSCGGAILLFTHTLARDRNLGMIESVLFMVCFMAVLIDALDDRYQLQLLYPTHLYLTFYAAPAFGLLLGLGMAATLARQSLAAQRVVRDANRLLQRALEQREHELEELHAEREQFRAEQAVQQERQRIVRDMHDGLSGQLTGLIAVSRDQTVERERIVDGLRVGLEELRMIVHSLDTVGDSLAQFLGSYRNRVREQIESLGINFEWQADPELSTLHLQPDAVLNIYRFIQEGVHNAVRHAGAEHIAVRLSMSNQRLRITINDSGCGLPAQLSESPAGGRGLSNLSLRAERLQAHLQVKPHMGLGGVGLILDLPVTPHLFDAPTN